MTRAWRGVAWLVVAFLAVAPAAAGDLWLGDPRMDGPGGPGPDGHRDKHGPPKPLSEAQVGQALEALRKIDPERADEFDRLAEAHPERLSSELRRRFPRIDHFLRLKEWDPEMYDLRVDDLRLAHATHRLAERYRRAVEPRGDDEPAPEPDARAMREELETLVEEHFEVRQRIRERELAALERRIEQLKQELDEREDDQREWVERRVEDLTTKDGRGEW